MDEDLDVTTEDEISRLRTKFKEKYQDSIENGEYDREDVERFDTDNVYTSRFYLHQKRDVEKAADMANVSLKWRKSMDLNSLSDASFPRWMHDMGAVFYHNTDKNGHSILNFQVAKNKKDPENVDNVKKFIAWWIDKTYKKSPENSIVVLFDMTGAGLSNMDINLIKFQITCFTTYFPYYLEYMLIYEMPWVLNAMWNIIKNLLTAEQQKRVIFTKKADVTQYIDEENLFTHMGGTDPFQYCYFQSEDSGIDTLANGDLLTDAAENDHFATTCKSSTSGSILRKRVTFRDRNDNNSNSPSEEKLNENSPGVYKGIIANVSPRDNLMFNVTDDKKETLDLLSILNTTSGTIAFKVKTTSPDSYRVRPSTALIKPGDTSVVSIYLQPGYMDSVVKDKFLIMIMVVSDRVRSTMEIVDLWKQPPSNHDEYMEHRLQCVAKKVDRDFTPDPGYRRAMALRQDSSRSDPTSKTTSGDQGLSSSTQEISGTSTENSTLASIERKMDLMLTRQSDLDKSVGRLYKFQIFIVFLMSCVVVLFLVVYVMEWRALDLYTEAIHYYQNT